jgi:hypothetical protein
VMHGGEALHGQAGFVAGGGHGLDRACGCRLAEGCLQLAGVHTGYNIYFSPGRAWPHSMEIKAGVCAFPRLYTTAHCKR